MLKELIKTKDWIIDLLMPKKCLGCGREGTYICKDCEVFLSEVDPMLGSPTSPVILGEIGLPNIVSVWEYEGLMEKLILKIKYDGCYDIVGELVETVFKKIDLNLPKDMIITFVPMYNKKERRRGFNQSELIAQRVGDKIGRPVVRLLGKMKDNQSQVGLGPQERLSNVKDVFQFQTKLSLVQVPSSVLLVDDVYTTGATMNECVKILKKGGIKSVYGFTLARKMNL
ncbi:MAG: ComF family protein [Patescibacteria group bacterium]